MSFFSQLKNLIKNNKNQSTTNNLEKEEESTKEKYETAQRIVENENIAKKTMPIFDGLDDYQIQSKLGDGAFSKVYQALKKTTNEKVAIKVVNKSELNQHQKSSILKEAQIMRTLNHPSVVKLLNFIETKKHYFLILELCEGGELFHQIVRLTYFSEDLARHCIKQVAEAIRYLHEERGVIHRDIKPENLLFTPIPFKERKNSIPPSEFDEPKEDEGEFELGIGGGGIGSVKIADFGLSKVVWNQQTMTPCGTVGYTAPEIVKDQRYSKSVDMWALGCVLYTLLCGFPPFYDESIKLLTEKVARGQFKFLSPWWDNISFEAKDLIDNLLCVNPTKRFTILQFLDHPWIKNQIKEVENPKNRFQSIPTPLTSFENTGLPLNGPIPETEAEAFKRFVQERARAEQELEAAVPSPGLPVINSRVQSRANSNSNSVHSGASTPRRDLFSGVTSMKEMFDISYTVHRMAEEKQRKKLLIKNYPDLNRRSVFIQHDSSSGTSDEGILSSSSQTTHEEDEGLSQSLVEDDLVRLDEKLNKIRINQTLENGTAFDQKPTVHSQKKIYSPKQSHKAGPFELNIENATLLGRRKVPNHNSAI